jgi:hypothetical protein
VTNEIELNDTFTPHPDLEVQVLDGEAVILNTRTGAYFGTNPVGTHIWQLYAEGKTVAEVVDGVVARFEVDAERAQADVLAFTESLLKGGLLSE